MVGTLGQFLIHALDGESLVRIKDSVINQVDLKESLYLSIENRL